ncbi:rod shape-determining protein MreC [Candidatus Uhrbacteria bacterium]|nr:rod shape-determining protein MreC [Candidatus Uhrbacteria bacterium]
MQTQWVIRLLLILSVGLVIAVLARTNIVRGFGGRFFGWFERPFTVVGTSSDELGEVFFASREELITELKDREAQVLQLAQTAARWEDDSRMLEQAQRLLSYTESSGETVLAAKVLVRTRSFQNEELLIDKGAFHGISLLDPVITGDGTFFGVVQEVFPQTSRIALVTNAESVVGASLLDQEGTTGIVSGGNGSLVRFGFVPRDTDVAVNDVVITSGIDPGIPRGLVIGLVNSIEEDENAPFLHLFVEPLADLKHVLMVGVIKTPVL